MPSSNRAYGMRLASWGVRVGLTALGACMVTTCKISDVLTEPGVEDVVVSFSTEDSTLVLGSTVAVPVAVTLNGEPFAEARLRVSSSDTTVVGVSAAGDSLIARKRGRAMVTVELVSSALPDSAPGVARTFQVVVDAVALDSSSVTFLSLRDTVRLEATVTDAAGAEVSGATVTWQSSDASVVGVNSSGRLLASRVGTAQVRAIVDFDTARAGVLVRNDPVAIHLSPDEASLTSVGDELVLSVAVLNRRSDTIPAAPVNARSTDTLVVRLSPSRDRAISVSTGTVRLIASTAGAGGATLADTTVVTVTNAPDELRIVPDLMTLRSIGDVDTPAVVIKNARGASLPRGAVSWTSDEPEIARVTPIGQVQARDTGTTTVRATSGSLEDSVLVLVTNDPASLRILGRDVDTLTALGQSLTYRVEVKNARGNVINDFPVVWRSTDLSVVDTVTPDGVATAAGFGTARLIAEARAAADTVTVVVRDPTRLFVDNSLVVTPRVGTLSRPYAKIQDAVNAADANDTVIVRFGTGRYPETVALTRRLTLLGDSGAFRSSGRNPGTLPLVAHDTGSAGITAFTTAPMTIRYLAVTHTLDGPAIEANGSDMVVEWFYVNRSGSVSSRIGRGISIANSPSGTRITNTVVDSVRGYGILLTNVSEAIVQSNTIWGVDSLADIEDGAGIEVVRGSGNTLTSNTIRATQGPQILASGSNQITLQGNSFAGRHQLVRLVEVTGNGLFSNTFDLNQRIQDGDDHQGSQNDGRSALAIESSSSVTVFSNTFAEAASAGTMDAVRLTQSRNLNLSRNVFTGGFRNIVSQRASFTVSQTRSDSARAFLTASDADTITLTADTLRNIVGILQNLGQGSGCVKVTGAASALVVRNSVFENCHPGAGAAIEMSSVGGSLDLSGSVFLGAHQTAFAFSGRSVSARENTASGAGTDPLPRNNVVGMSATADTVILVSNVVSGYRRGTGISAAGSARAFLDGNRVTLNGVGMRLGASGSLQASTNDVFDNDTLGLVYGGSGSVFVLGIWWGDDRGPRRSTAPAAVGDSAGPNVVSDPVRTTPVNAGSGAAALRIVRGNGQSAAAGSTLSRAFTVRVVDASGRPVSGVSVTFTVTGGGGNFGGSSSVIVASNASGLAEATLTLGGGAPANSATATGTSASIGTATFTATGT